MLPRGFSFKKLLTGFSTVYDVVRSVAKIDEYTFDDVSTRVRRAMELQPSFDPVVRDAVSLFYGISLDFDGYRALAWRLAAGRSWLEEGHTLDRDFRVRPASWVPLMIEQVRFREPSKRTGREMLSVKFMVLSGPFAGLTFGQSIASSFVIYKMAADIGFSRRDPPAHPFDLTGMFLAGVLSTEELQYLRITEFGVSSSALSLNRALRKVRNEPCPRGYAWLCSSCPAGRPFYEQVEPCARATHPRRFELLQCKRCSQEKLHDPVDKAMCIDCRKKLLGIRMKVMGE